MSAENIHQKKKQNLRRKLQICPPANPKFLGNLSGCGFFHINNANRRARALESSPKRPHSRCFGNRCLPPLPQLISQVSCSSSMHRSSSAGSKHVCILAISEIAECSLGIPFPSRTSSSSHAIRASIGLSERTRIISGLAMVHCCLAVPPPAFVHSILLKVIV